MPKVKYCVTEFTPTANLLSPLWPLGLWTLATRSALPLRSSKNGTQEGGGYKAGVLRRAKRQSRAEIRLAA